MEFQMTGAGMYRQVDQASRIEGASAHGLIAVLLEEAIAQIATLEVAYRQNRIPHPSQARVSGLLHGLEACLDLRSGGKTADLMAQVYRETRRCLTRAADENDPLWCDRARVVLSPIVQAWQQIGGQVHQAA